MGTIWGYHNLQVWLDHGFTSLRDAGESDLAYGQLALRDAINRGLIRGARILSAGNFISVTGGHGDADVLAPDQMLPRRPNLADTVDQVSEAVRHDLKYGVDWIKLMATGGVMDPLSDYSVQELSEAQMARAVEVAHRAGKHVMAHAEGTEGIKAAARAGVDSIEHGTMLDEEGATVMEQHSTWLVPTLYTFQHGVEQGASLGADPIMVAKGKAILAAQRPAFSLLRGAKWGLVPAAGEVLRVAA
jgi:imidazolonepropionase-like amidohydrolase